MPTPPLSGKDALINQFITDVIDHAVNQVQRDRSDVPSLDFSATSPIVYKNSLRVSPDDLSSIGTASAVPSRGGLINASALVDLFLAYSHNLTSIRKCTLKRVNQQPTSAANLVTVWSNQITSLHADYKMSAGSFKTALSASNALNNLQPGNVAEPTAITTLINALQTIVDNNMNSAVTVTVCHSSCHSSCHGSRGRR